eukprot:TRINITY_DN285_c0_g1_i8.p1 TRINITY_DN285_c0_g1~~TRINITY_DN285_c0_g1_i8.p1  ORF type:complete len:632 (-),score=205.96 TRINITY_DN285_c0_g1_i8:226-2121(-)
MSSRSDSWINIVCVLNHPKKRIPLSVSGLLTCTEFKAAIGKSLDLDAKKMAVCKVTIARFGRTPALLDLDEWSKEESNENDKCSERAKEKAEEQKNASTNSFSSSSSLSSSASSSSHSKRIVKDVLSDGCVLLFHYPVLYFRRDIEKDDESEEKESKERQKEDDDSKRFKGLKEDTILSLLSKHETEAITVAQMKKAKKSKAKEKEKAKEKQSRMQVWWEFFDIHCGKLLRKVEDNSAFLSISPSLLSVILGRDSLSATELTLLRALIYWGMNQASSSSSPSSSSSCSSCSTQSSQIKETEKPKEKETKQSKVDNANKKGEDDDEVDSKKNQAFSKVKHKTKRKSKKKHVTEDDDEEEESDPNKLDEAMDIPRVTKDVQTIIAPFISLIRFPIMPLSVIAAQVTSSGVLAQQQLLDLFQYCSLASKTKNDDNDESEEDEKEALSSKKNKLVPLPKSISSFSAKRRVPPELNVWQIDKSKLTADYTLKARVLTRITSGTEWRTVPFTKWIASGVKKIKFRILQFNPVRDYLEFGLAFSGFASWNDYLGANSQSVCWQCGASESVIYYNSSDTAYGSQWKNGDVVTMIVDMNKHQLSFELNGVNQGIASSTLPDRVLPAFCTYDAPNCSFRVL